MSTSGSQRQVHVDREHRVVMAGDCELVVRELSRSDLNRCAAAARLGDDFGSRAVNAELMARRALATQANEGKTVRHWRKGGEVRIRFQAIDVVGTVVTEEVFDALSEDQIAQVVRASQGQDLTEDQAGNSAGPPRGSTDNASGSGPN